MSDLRPGSVFAGHVIERRLGSGGWGTVYVARDLRFESRLTALKVLDRASIDGESQRRFLREGDLLTQLDDHPNIVTIYGRGVEGPIMWISMQYVPGVDASSLTGVSPDRVVRIGSEIAAALDYAHSAAILHRDVKPANILLGVRTHGAAERVLLTDFGIASQGQADLRLTRTGTVHGTADFIAPEQASGGPVGQWSDQYSLACTLFQLLTDQPVFAPRETIQLMIAHITEKPRTISDFRPNLGALDPVFARALAKNPHERFGTCTEFVEMVERTLREALRDGTGTSIAAPRVSTGLQSETASPQSISARQSWWVTNASSSPAIAPPRNRHSAEVPSVTAVTGPRRTDRDASLLLGRDIETARMIALAARVVATGRIRLVLIEGDAGIGKSAMLRHLVRELQAVGWTSAHGRCPETDGAPAAWAWVELVSALAQHGYPTPAALCPLLAPLQLSAPTVSEADMATAQFRLHRDIVAYLTEVARNSPLLVTLDDLHRADEATLALLHALAASPVQTPVLAVATYRPTEVSSGAVTPFTDVLARLAALHPTRWTLSGLPDSAVAELITRVSRVDLDDDAVRSVTDRTGGNPFFVTEIARMLEHGDAQHDLSKVPPGVRDVVRLRYAVVPPQAQRVLRAAAVLGRAADYDILAALLDLDLNDLADALDPLLAAGLIIESDSGAVCFAHALVRDTVYEGISRIRAISLHARAGAAYERLRPLDAAALSHHWLAAAGVANPAPEVVDSAVRYSRVAAEQAESQYAHHESARLWQAALNVHRGDARVRFELLLGSMRTLALSGQMTTAMARRAEAVALAAEFGDPHSVARALVGLPPSTWVYRDSFTISEGVADALERTLAAPSFDDDVLRCRVLVTWAIELFHSTDRARRAAQEAYRLATALENPQLQSLALTALLYQSHWRTGLSSTRRAIALQLRALARQHGLVATEVIAELALLDADCTIGDFAAADRHLEVVLRLAADHDLPLQITECGWYRAQRQVVMGDIEGALAIARHTANEVSGLGGQWGLESATHDLVKVYWALSHGTMTTVLDLTTRLFTTWPDFAHVRFLHALALSAHNRREEARKIVAESDIQQNLFLTVTLCASGRVGVALGDNDRVEHAYRSLLPARDELVVMVCRGVVGPVAQDLGEFADYLGDRNAAIEHFQHAIVVARRCGSTFWTDQARSAIERLTAATPPGQWPENAKEGCSPMLGVPSSCR